MKGFSRWCIFTDQEVDLFHRAVRIVDQLPEREQTCHEVAEIVAEELKLPVVRGWYGMVTHSWLALPSGSLLDVYVPGRYPPVQLVDANTVTLPKCYRTSVDE